MQLPETQTSKFKEEYSALLRRKRVVYPRIFAAASAVAAILVAVIVLTGLRVPFVVLGGIELLFIGAFFWFFIVSLAGYRCPACGRDPLGGECLAFCCLCGRPWEELPLPDSRVLPRTSLTPTACANCRRPDIFHAVTGGRGWGKFYSALKFCGRCGAELR